MILTRMAKLQVLVFLLISAIGISYVGLTYVGIGRRDYVVHLDFARGGGLFVNAPVTYRGVPVGRVEAVRLTAAGVRADLSVEQDVRVPADLRAVVGLRSAVGEQYVDLRPARDGGPYLSDGSVIPASRTGTPLPVEMLLTNLDELVRSVDGDKLNVVITELGTAFEGNAAALQLLLDSSDALLESGQAYLPQTGKLIDDAKTVLTTQAVQSAQLRRWASALADLSGTLRASDPDLRRLLTAGPPAADELTALLRGLDPTVGTLLGNLITVNGIAVRRLDGIEQILVTYPLVVAGGFTVVPGDGTAHFGLVVNANDPPPCQYSQTGARTCTDAELAAGSGVRSERNAPRPGGRGTVAPAPDGGAGPAPAAGSAPVAGYDPGSGLVTGADGLPLAFGGTGGQYAVAGAQSWKQLLLSGVAP
ncbi:MlaD family protein [Actinoplanes sp. NBRC 103695]|uniref:MCE family protein n=1 Tax=Actinoplanes sp. NBRC 103695 TaxID=3032202 RepID=UPI0024A065B1|nr:MlaD family protein [Actinoplanes sp. NBRC 103695]GLY97864.1 ABC transporter substrate-binding protein [Actinoplanes sp. NBRC 103695]